MVFISQALLRHHGRASKTDESQGTFFNIMLCLYALADSPSCSGAPLVKPTRGIYIKGLFYQLHHVEHHFELLFPAFLTLIAFAHCKEHYMNSEFEGILLSNNYYVVRSITNFFKRT